MYYYLFFQSRLIPRWLSALVCRDHPDNGGLRVGLFNDNPITEYILLAFPIFLQEMVLAVWLIVKGFNPSAIALANQA